MSAKTSSCKSIQQLALELAIDMKACDDTDAGNFWFEGDHGHLTDDEWDHVCDQAMDLLPTVKVPAKVREAWARADREYAAERQAESRAFACDY